MELFFRRSKAGIKSHSCGSLSANGGVSSYKEKSKSPKFMARLMEHIPLNKSASSSSVNTHGESVKYRPKDIASILRRKVVTPSVQLRDDSSNSNKEEKKKKKKLRKYIKSAYSERDPEKSALTSSQSKGPVFGVPLGTAVQRSRVSDRLPLCRVFQDSIMYIETHALTREGIYRVPGFRVKLNELKTMYNRGDAVKLTNYDPETVGMLLKLYLRELPEPLLTRQLGAQFEGVLQYDDTEQRTAVLCAMLRQLPPEHYATLAWLCLHMNHVSLHEKQNKMTLSNLIIILSPTLLISNTLLRCLCENAVTLFPGVALDPNKRIPTVEELHSSSHTNDSSSETDTSPAIVREDVVQSLVWAQARNDALRYMKDQLRAQIVEERRLVSSYQHQIRDLEGQGYAIGDTVVLRNSRRPKTTLNPTTRNPSARNPTTDTDEDLQLYLGTLEQINTGLEADKTNLYNSIISETFACIDAYTEIKFRQSFAAKTTSSS